MRWQLLPIPSASWDDLLRSLRADVYHRSEYVRLEADRLGAQAVGFVASRGQLRWAVPLLLRRFERSAVDATSPYGYPGPLSNAPPEDAAFHREALCSLREALAERCVISIFLRLHPILSPPATCFRGVGSVEHHGQTVSIDLSLPDDERWAQTRPNHRRQILRARRLGADVFEDVSWASLDVFTSLYRATMRRVGAQASYQFPMSYFEALRDHLDGRAHLVVVQRGSSVGAGGIFTESDGIVQYHLGATSDADLGWQPSKIMFDFVSRWARHRGDEFLHLGGGVGAAPDSLFHFKAGFSATRHRFATWRLIIDTERYQQMVVPAGSPVGERAEFFPEYRRETLA